MIPCIEKDMNTILKEFKSGDLVAVYGPGIKTTLIDGVPMDELDSEQYFSNGFLPYLATFVMASMMPAWDYFVPCLVVKVVRADDSGQLLRVFSEQCRRANEDGTLKKAT